MRKASVPAWLALGMLVSLWQISLFPALPWPLRTVNLVTAALIFTNVIIGHRPALLLGLACGFVVDIFSSLPFGIITGSYLFIVLVAEQLFQRFFTNRSLYSLLLIGAAGFALYSVVTTAAVSIVFTVRVPGFEAQQPASLLPFAAWQILLNSALLSAGYGILRAFSRRLKSTFA